MPRIIYEILTKPPLQPPGIQTGWFQPFTEPVRRRSLTTAVVVASGLFAPVFVPPTPTISFAANDSVVPYTRAVLYPALQQPVSFSVAAETITVDKWLASFSQPALRRGLPAHQQQALAFVEAAPFPETVSADRWQQALSQPTLRKPIIQPDGLSWSYVTPTPAETVTIDKWFAPASQPRIPQRALPAHQQPSLAFLEAAPFEEAVSEDKWHRPLSEPTRRKNFAEHPAWFPAYYFPAQPDITVEKWHAPLSVPTRLRMLPTAEQTAGAYVEAAPFAETVSADRWQQPLSEPVRRKPTVHPPALTWSGFTPIAEVITLDKWYRPASQPILPRRGLETREQPFLSFVKASPFAEAVSIDRWLRPLSEPVRRIRQAEYPASFLVWLPPPVVVTNVASWHVPLSVPVRRRGLETREQPFLAFVKAAPFGLQPPTITVTSWFRPLSLPTRLLGLPTREQPFIAFVKAAPFPGGPEPEPAPTPPLFGGADFLTADILVDGFSNERKSAAVRSTMESGFDRVRLTDRNPLRIMNVVIQWTAAQAEYFDAWYEYTLQTGELWFQASLPIEGTPRVVTARFLGEPTQRPIGPIANIWQLSAQLEINDPNLVLRNTFAGADSGIFPSDIVGDAVMFDEFSHQLQPAGVSTDQSVQGVRQYRTSTRTPFRTMSLSWWFDDDQLAYFNEWLEYRARHEAAFFSIDVPIERDTYRTVRARFVSPPRITAVAPIDLWLCTAQIEARDINSLTPSELALLAAFFAEVPYDDLLAMIAIVEGLSLEPFFEAWEDLS